MSATKVEAINTSSIAGKTTGTVSRKRWADMSDDEFPTAMPEFSSCRTESKSSSSTSTPATTSPKQSWADMSEDDISEGEVDALPIATADLKRQETEDIATAPVGVPVEVRGMPRKLCTKMFLDVIIEQIDLESQMCGHDIFEEHGEIVAIIKFANVQAAVKCKRHLESCSWATGALKVVLGTETSATEANTADMEAWFQGAVTSVDEAADAAQKNCGSVAPTQPRVAPAWQTSGKQAQLQYEYGTLWQIDAASANMQMAYVAQPLEQWDLRCREQWMHKSSGTCFSHRPVCATRDQTYASSCPPANNCQYFASAEAHEVALAQALKYAGKAQIATA